MANIKVKAASIFINGKKAGTLEGTDYEYNSGDEPVFGDPGYVTSSDGAITTRVTATGFNPVPGSGLLLFQAMNNKQDVDVSLFPIDGGVHTITMRPLTGKAQSSHKTGMQSSNYTFIGGQPKIS
jgi:hypothetical protein